MSVLKKPDLTDPKLRAKLAKGMGLPNFSNDTALDQLDRGSISAC